MNMKKNMANGLGINRFYLPLHCQKSRFDAAVKHRRLGREVRGIFRFFLLYVSKLFNIFAKTKRIMIWKSY